MTCARVVDVKKCTIMVRKTDDETFKSKSRIFYMNSAWDLSLLIVKGGNAKYDVPFAEFVEDGTIASFQTLLHVGHVGHSHHLVWSLFVGRAVYPCVNNCLPNKDSVVTCASYKCLAYKKTPLYRIIGDVWDQDDFSQIESTDFLFEIERNLSAHIPIIQCAGLLCKGTCPGGPVFNTEGQIVGMIIGEKDGCEVAIHVTLLKEFLKNSTTKDATKKKKQPVT